MYHLLYTTELACANIATSASVAYGTGSVPVYHGLDTDTKALTYIVCSAENANEDFPESGIWHVKTAIQVVEMVPDLTSGVTTLTDKVFSYFLTGSIETDLSHSVGNYAVYNVTTEDMQRTIQDNQWVNTLMLDVVCALTN